MTTETAHETAGTRTPALHLKFYSHATLECSDLQRTRQFFDEFLGLETASMTEVSFGARLGGNQLIVVVKNPNRAKAGTMSLFNHNGLDVGTEAEVDQAHAIVKRDAEKWGLKRITRPLHQHGTYSFYFWDLDDNAWEILSNPPGGYGWVFKDNERNTPG
ncbi:MAG: VOC family protein [Cystobacter sp.]